MHPGTISQGQCGYPLCKKELGEERLALRPGQKRIDAKQRRIVDVTRETTMVRRQGERE